MKTKSNYRYFLGADISKDTIDFTLLQGPKPLLHEKIANQPSDIKAFVKSILEQKGLTRGNLLAGMENMGFYGNHLTQMLTKLKVRYVSEHALNIKRALGMVRGKSDKMDSLRIALHFYKSRDLVSLTIPKRPQIERLALLSSMRERLIKIELQLKNPLKQSQGFLARETQLSAKQICASSCHALKADIKAIEQSIQDVWKADTGLSRLMKIMLSVPSVGEVTAVQILINTNEFRNISDAKKFACYCGVAPFPISSGSALDKGTRTSKMCNKRMKGLIRTCAVSASRFVPDIAEYYQRKQQEGKHKMSVLNAIGFKVISRVFTCIRQDRCYQKDYAGTSNQPKIFT